ncbi:hypothetical protein DB30_00787 [Enhygromyxa salina]|uniref:Uncharacterized protein n=1 Tax=Enhygromyxa salina TaxID=215803 RepID=A0A0C1ZPQ4_9BACT|nr:hypothetical protein [Enhygromyxa salina]KIG13013.1 hypothetical protein DB30_00787 [Enhygromyxa salina]
MFVAAGLGLALGGCTEIPDIAYETQHFEIAPDFDYPICAGTLAYFESHLRFVESSLSRTVPFGERIRFYWITKNLDSWCSERALGCYYPGTRVIIGTGESVSHEIVHAVLNAEAQTNYFLEEGVAELYSGVGAYRRPAHDSRPDPSELLWLSPTDYRFGELDYAVAAHFMAYVEHQFGDGSTRGIADVVVTAAGPPELEASFKRFTGVSFAQLGEDYDRYASNYYRGLHDEDITPIETKRWIDVSLRCDQDDTFGPLPDASPGMYRSLRLELDEPRTVDIELRAPERVSVEIVDVRRERSYGVVLDFRHPKPSGAHEHPIVRGGESTAVHLRAGTHLLTISQSDYEYSDAFLRVDPRQFPRGDDSQ